MGKNNLGQLGDFSIEGRQTPVPIGTGGLAVAAGFDSSAIVVSNEPSPLNTTRLSNLSVRTSLDVAQTLIVGFTMQGGTKPVLVRAVGPGLGSFGVTGAMTDPRMTLFNGATSLETNDNWGGSSTLQWAPEQYVSDRMPPYVSLIRTRCVTESDAHGHRP